MPWLYQHKGKSNVWWIGYRLRGRQFLRSTGHRDRAKAEAELEKVNAMVASQKAGVLTQELYEHLTGKALPTITLKAELEGWLKEARGTTGERTVERYEYIARELTAYFKADDKGPMVDSITREEIQGLLSSFRGRLSAGTANFYRKIVSGIFKRARALGHTRENPVEGIPAFKQSRAEKRVRRPFTHAEVATLYRIAPDAFWRYMVLGGFTTGLRLGDLATMPVGAVDWKNRTLRLTTRKTGRQMFIPLSPPFFKLLTARKAELGATENTSPLWPEHAARYEENSARWFGQRFYDLLLVPAGLVKVRPHRKATSKKVKRVVNDVSFHCLRHAFVSTMAASGQNQQVVKELAGHSDDAINDLYTHLPEEILTAAIKQLPDVTKE